ncbi:MAG: hypothetical protein LBG81_05340 [Coriobacteriaceae bacterium]|nr:hypothetical protein [Coriobacteriaceae bacterium]
MTSEKQDDVRECAERALNDEGLLLELIDNLSGASRRLRQTSATALALVAKEKPDLLAGHVGAFVDALNRPEAQTRWECLDILTTMVDKDSRTCDKAAIGAETALFDEESGPLRLAAMRFLCKLGATTENRSERLWPYIDEGIQCCHGDLEFPEMLTAVFDFAGGKLSKPVRKALAARMGFDAENSKGSLKRRAQQIIERASR